MSDVLGMHRDFTLVLTAPVMMPAPQHTPLNAALHAVGINTVTFPLIDIAPVDDAETIAMLDQALAEINRYALLFFVSPNAIACTFERAAVLGVPLADKLSQPCTDRPFASPASAPGTTVDTAALSDDPRPWLAVVGPGSVRALAARQVNAKTHRLLAPQGALEEAERSASLDVAAHAIDAAAGGNGQHAFADAPAAQAIRYDSEALLQALDAALLAYGGQVALKGRRALVIRGDGGRELFADALRDAGMQVDVVTAYRRTIPVPTDATWQDIEALLRAGRHSWLLTSSEGIRNLSALTAARWAGQQSESAPDLRQALRQTPVIVTHHRIAAAASAAGFDTITNPGVGDTNIVRAVLAASERT